MGQMTTLIEVIGSLDSLNLEDTIYAVEPWTSQSKVFVACEPSSGGLPDEVQRTGAKYFLEVFIARNFIEDWKTGLHHEPTLAETCARLIQYAINDV